MDVKNPPAEQTNPTTMDMATPPPMTDTEKAEPAAKAPAVTSDATPAEAAQPTQPAPTRTHNTAIVAIVMAIVIAIGLGGIGGMAYMNTKKNVQPAAQNEAVSATPKVSSNDIKKTVDDMNTSIKTIDDNQDFGAADLSDTTLGIQ